uniref:Nucleotide-diphospho-sugar transferase domain-containing protein n=1 Tax=Bursaphelenchus xylophilus TaxID=6326 RepID=A0A1I7RZT1_BURXY
MKSSTRRTFGYLLLLLTILSFAFLYLDAPRNVFGLTVGRNVYALEKAISDVYVVLSGDMNFHYLLATPFAVQHWLNFNVSSIVMLCGKQTDYEKDKAANEVIKELNRLGAVIIYLQNHTLNSNNFAQNMRNYAVATKFVQEELNEKTVLMTSDVDFFPFHKEHHIPEVSNGKEIFFYNPDCCGFQQWKELSYKQYIMITIAMTVRRWREVMDISPTDRATGKYVEEKTNATFDGELQNFLNDKEWMWYLDQRLFGLRYHHASHKYDYKTLVSTYTGPRRLDRSVWKRYPKDKFEKIKINEWDDAHTSPAIYTDEWWKLNLPFYKKIFPKDQLEKLIAYRERAVENINQEDAAKRHFHP